MLKDVQDLWNLLSSHAVFLLEKAEASVGRGVVLAGAGQFGSSVTGV